MDYPVLGEISRTVMAGSMLARPPGPAPELAALGGLREEKAAGADDLGRGINSAAVFGTLTEVAPADAVLRSTWATTPTPGRYFECHENRV